MADSHKRDTNARRTPSAAMIAAPIAIFATLASVSVGVVAADSEKAVSVSANQASIADVAGEREQQVSRSTRRSLADVRAAAVAAERAATRKAIRNATKHLWTTEELNLWSSADKKAKLHGTIDAGKKVLVTGRRQKGRAEIVLGNNARWVTADYLATEKPVERQGISGTACPDGSGIEAGLQPAAVRVYRAVCAAFPELSSYGGQDGHGEHVNGEAIDFMVPSYDVGERVRDYLFAHRYELGLFDIIWAQQIWTIERDGEGFRGMSSRGSATANHMDHVHIKIL